MAPDNEHDRPMGGPPPDPSMRAWRHPSEVAAANAAAARTDLPPRSRWSRRSFGSRGAAGAVGAAVLLTGVVVVASLGGGEPEFDPIDPATGNASMTDAAAPVQFETREPAPVHPTASATEVTEVSGAQLERSLDWTSTTGLLTTTTLTTRAIRLPGGDDNLAGIIALYDTDGTTPVASALLIDGLVLTSASALGDRHQALAVTDNGMSAVDLQGTDLFTDLAVLTPVEPEDFAMAEITVAEDVEPLGTQCRLVAHDGESDLIVVEGNIISYGERATTRDGHPVLDTLYTTARFPDAAAGAALLDDQGRTVGMVIDSNDYLAVAVPIERVRTIGQSIMHDGWAHPGWIGTSGKGTEYGVTITQIDPDGPAALAGLAVGDVIVSINGEPVTGMADVVRWVRDAGVGGQLSLVVRTESTDRQTTVEVGRRPVSPADATSATNGG